MVFLLIRIYLFLFYQLDFKLRSSVDCFSFFLSSYLKSSYILSSKFVYEDSSLLMSVRKSLLCSFLNAFSWLDLKIGLLKSMLFLFAPLFSFVSLVSFKKRREIYKKCWVFAFLKKWRRQIMLSLYSCQIILKIILNKYI